MTTATLYRTTISHARTETVDHGFTYRQAMWLVDLDNLPRVSRCLGLLFRFDAADHLGDPDRSIRGNVDVFLAGHDIDLDGGRILMLAIPRSLGHGFNPLSIYWCYCLGGGLACIVAEVHNTHGESHCYLLRPDANGVSRVAKEFYVSPFFAVDGAYDVRCTEPGDQVLVSITLVRGAALQPVFTATLMGQAEAPVRSILWAAFRHSCASWRVSALIRWQGLRLWLQRLPVVPWSAPTQRPAPPSASPSAVRPESSSVPKETTR